LLSWASPSTRTEAAATRPPRRRVHQKYPRSATSPRKTRAWPRRSFLHHREPAAARLRAPVREPAAPRATVWTAAPLRPTGRQTAPASATRSRRPPGACWTPKSPRPLPRGCRCDRAPECRCGLLQCHRQPFPLPRWIQSAKARYPSSRWPHPSAPRGPRNPFGWGWHLRCPGRARHSSRCYPRRNRCPCHARAHDPRSAGTVEPVAVVVAEAGRIVAAAIVAAAAVAASATPSRARTARGACVCRRHPWRMTRPATCRRRRHWRRNRHHQRHRPAQRNCLGSLRVPRRRRVHLHLHFHHRHLPASASSRNGEAAPGSSMRTPPLPPLPQQRRKKHPGAGIPRTPPSAAT